MEFGLMAGYMKMQHGREAEERCIWSASPPGEEPRMYQMTFPTKGGPRSFPVDGCTVRLATRTAMRVYFLHRHVRDTVVILEEGNLPYPR